MVSRATMHWIHRMRMRLGVGWGVFHYSNDLGAKADSSAKPVTKRSGLQWAHSMTSGDSCIEHVVDSFDLSTWR